MLFRIFVFTLLTAVFLVGPNLASAKDFCVKPLMAGHPSRSGVETIPTGSGSGGEHQCPHLQHQTGGCPISHGAGSSDSRYLSKCPPDLPASEIAFSMQYHFLVPRVTGVEPQEMGHYYTPYLLQKVTEPNRLEPRPPTI